MNQIKIIGSSNPSRHIPFSELLTNVPFFVCSVCYRKSFTASDRNELCGMTQPSGVKCQGKFIDAAASEH